MAEIWAAAIGVGISAWSARNAAKQGERGAQGQDAAAAAATAEQRRQYDLTRQDQLPFLQGAYDALNRQQAALEGDFSGFEDSPDYAFARQQALQSQERGAAARGGFMGGGADADRMTLASGLASQNFGNYWNRLAGRAGQGQSAATTLGGLGANMATNIGGNLMDAANARASSYANTANQWGNFGNQAAGAFGSWYGGLGRDSRGAYLGNQRGRG